MARSLKPDTGRALHGALGVIFGGLGWQKAAVVTSLVVALGVATNAASDLLLSGFNQRSSVILALAFFVLFASLSFLHYHIRKGFESELMVKLVPETFQAKAIIMALSLVQEDKLSAAKQHLKGAKTIADLDEQLKKIGVFFPWIQNLIGIERHASNKNAASPLEVAIVPSPESLEQIEQFKDFIRNFFDDRVKVLTPLEVLGPQSRETCEINKLHDNFETLKALRSYFIERKLGRDLVLDITSGTKIYSSASTILSSGDGNTKIQYVDNQTKMNSSQPAITIFTSACQYEFQPEE